MNTKERLLKAIRFEKVDRIPVVPRLNALDFLRELYGKTPTWKDHLKCSMEFGFDPVFYVNPGFIIKDIISEDKNMNRQDKGDYFLITHEYKTPIKTLSTKIREYKNDPQVNLKLVSSEKTDEFLIKNEEDIPAFRYLIRDFKEDDFKKFSMISKRVGDQGLAMGCIPHPLTWIIETHGLAETLIDIHQNTGFIKELLNIFQEKAVTCVEWFSRAGAEIIYTDGVWTTTDLISPSDFEQLIAPIIEEQVRLTKKEGMLFHYFMDGKFMDNLMVLKRTGIDILSPLCPYPVGDADFNALKQEMRGKICLWGGINSTELFSVNELEIKKMVKSLIESVGGDTGFILSTTASVQPGTSPRVFRSFIEAGKEFGRYR